MLGGAIVADTTRAHHVLETSHPPVYVPLADVVPDSLELSGGRALDQGRCLTALGQPAGAVTAP